MVLECLVGVLVWAGLVAYTLAAARGDLVAGRAVLAGLQSTSAEQVAAGTTADDVEVALQRFRQAERRLDSPVLAPLRYVPVARRQLQSVDALNTAAIITLVEAAQTLELIDSSLEGLGDPEGRIDALRDIASAARSADRRFATIDLGPDDRLVAQLAAARTEFSTELGAVREMLGSTAETTEGLAGFLQGPRRYVIVGANNSEMRAGSGMFLIAGTMETNNGSITISDLQSVSAYTDWDQFDLPIPDPDVARNWGYSRPSVAWQNMNLSPRFETSGPLAAQLWSSLAQGDAEGLIALDPMALAALMSVSDNVSAAGRAWSPDEVVQYLLYEQYIEFENAEKAERQSAFGQIASAVLQGATAGGQDPVAVLRSLESAAEGRHILAWSSDGLDQRLWNQLGVSGSLADDSLAIAVNNVGANKLDYFIDVDAELDGAPASDGSSATDFLLQVDVTNTATTDTAPGYYAPRLDGVDVVRGQYVGLLAVNLPSGAEQVAILQPVAGSTVGRDGPTTLARTAHFTLLPGESTRFEVAFRIPGRRGRLQLEPSARVPSMTWTLEGEQRSEVDSRRTALSWSADGSLQLEP